MIIKRPALALIIGASFAMSGAVIAEGVDLAADKCEHCHNANNDNEKVPNIAGFSALYFKDTLEHYKTEERPAGEKIETEGNEPTDMKMVAESLSEEEITALADYFATQESKAIPQEVDSELVKKGKKVYKKRCKNCHADGGSDPEDDAGILAGQHMSYLREQISLFRKNAEDKKDGRQQSKKMRKKIKKISDADAEALVHFFASQSQ
ncbi:MAG: c-type cytochrome [Thiomargarita sp.]|nr:c-type cytochrome [Thiomargarita sp.]